MNIQFTLTLVKVCPYNSNLHMKYILDITTFTKFCWTVTNYYVVITFSYSRLQLQAKLHFTGTTSWYFNQRVDENINNWRNYQMLMKISKAIDKNVNNRKGDNLTKI